MNRQKKSESHTDIHEASPAYSKTGLLQSTSENESRDVVIIQTKDCLPISGINRDMETFPDTVKLQLTEVDEDSPIFPRREHLELLEKGRGSHQQLPASNRDEQSSMNRCMNNQSQLSMTNGDAGTSLMPDQLTLPATCRDLETFPLKGNKPLIVADKDMGPSNTREDRHQFMGIDDDDPIFPGKETPLELNAGHRDAVTSQSDHLQLAETDTGEADLVFPSGKEHPQSAENMRNAWNRAEDEMKTGTQEINNNSILKGKHSNQHQDGNPSNQCQDDVPSNQCQDDVPSDQCQDNIHSNQCHGDTHNNQYLNGTHSNHRTCEMQSLQLPQTLRKTHILRTKRPQVHFEILLVYYNLIIDN